LKSDSGQIVGVEMDLARAMASVMGLEFRPVEQDFAMILPSIQGGQLDIGVSGFTDTEERRENFDFVNYLYAGIQWAQPTSTSEPADPTAHRGLTMPAPRTPFSETADVQPQSQACVKKVKEQIEILRYATSNNAAIAALPRRADAFSADSPVTAY